MQYHQKFTDMKVRPGASELIPARNPSLYYQQRNPITKANFRISIPTVYPQAQ
jgi:hypothetical protein